VLGQAAFAAWSLVAGYSLLMYREFFIGRWLRPRLATYAVMHTLVACWIATWTFCAATGREFADMPASYAQLVFANWAVFNLFEFGRKTFGVEEERGPDESYSKRFGPVRAAANVLRFCPNLPVATREQILVVIQQCSNGFFRSFVNDKVHLMAYQTVNAQGQPVDIIPATADADPGYHTGLSIIDYLRNLARLS
jgi:hypothetical protein